MRSAPSAKRERILAAFIFVLWLLAVVFPSLKIDIFTPANELGPMLAILAGAYLLINALALVYSLYMLVSLYRASLRRTIPHVLWRAALYLYATIGISVAIYTALQAIF